MTDEKPPVEPPVTDRPYRPQRQHVSADVAPELYPHRGAESEAERRTER